jgi:WD40 repeat protein
MSIHRSFILGTYLDESTNRLFTSLLGPSMLWFVITRTQRILTAGHDRSVGIWDKRDGCFLQRLEGHFGGVLAVSVSDQWIASASYDATIAIWNRTSGAQVTILEGHRDAVTGVTFVDENTLVSSSRDCTLVVWDLAKR